MSEEILEFDTVPGFPLGQPPDGRPRYGMTPQQAQLYRWLVQSRPHHVPFRLHFRDAAEQLGMALSSVHWCLMELVDRGWVEQLANGAHTQFQMVPPVKRFGSVPTEARAAG